MSQIVFEGDVRLEYSAGDTDRKIIITGSLTETLSNYIARQLGFPNEIEFDAMLQKLRAQQVGGVYNAEECDATREGVRLLVTVEVLNPGVGNQ